MNPALPKNMAGFLFYCSRKTFQRSTNLEESEECWPLVAGVWSSYGLPLVVGR